MTATASSPSTDCTGRTPGRGFGCRSTRPALGRPRDRGVRMDRRSRRIGRRTPAPVPRWRPVLASDPTGTGGVGRSTATLPGSPLGVFGTAGVSRSGRIPASGWRSPHGTGVDTRPHARGACRPIGGRSVSYTTCSAGTDRPAGTGLGGNRLVVRRGRTSCIACPCRQCYSKYNAMPTRPRPRPRPKPLPPDPKPSGAGNLGWQVLRFTPAMIESGEAIDVIEEAIEWAR
jgi:hypothetical protein